MDGSWLRQPVFTLQWPTDLHTIRSLIAFLVVGGLLVLPFLASGTVETVREKRGRVLGASVSAVELIETAVSDLQAGRYSLASERFHTADSELDTAQSEIRSAGPWIPVIRYLPVIGRRLRSGEALLAAGRHLTRGGSILADGLAGSETVDDGTAEPLQVTDALSSLGESIGPALDDIHQAADLVSRVSPDDLPASQADQLRSIQARLPELSDSLDQVRPLVDLLTTVLGFTRPQRYLLVFQNTHEMRATGGFLGSFALVDIDHGQIRQLEIPGGGPYDLASQLTEKVIAPQPLHLVNPRWYFQDANWWPDWPTSAAKMMRFYEQSGGPTVDGILSVTPAVAEDLLRITGSIDLQADYGTTVTAENFVEVALREVEHEYDKTANRPKAFIADVVQAVFDRLFTASPDQLLPVLTTLERSLAEKQLMIFHREATVASAITERGWSGAMSRAGDGDYLMVVHTNIGGGKTDGVIETSINHQVEVQPDQTIIDTVTVRRAHHGQPGEVFTGIKNNDYLRVYVPAGSQLQSASGFQLIDPKLFLAPPLDAQPDPDLQRIQGQVLIDENSGMRVYDELGYTVFANWLTVEPGHVAEAVITYRLPPSLRSDQYRLRVEKQPGDFGASFQGSIAIPAGQVYHVTENLVEQPAAEATRRWTIETSLERDLIYGLVR